MVVSGFNVNVCLRACHEVCLPVNCLQSFVVIFFCKFEQKVQRKPRYDSENTSSLTEKHGKAKQM